MKKALKVALELGHRYTGNLLKGIDSKTVKGQLISKCLFVTEEILVTVSRRAPAFMEAWHFFFLFFFF